MSEETLLTAEQIDEQRHVLEKYYAHTTRLRQTTFPDTSSFYGVPFVYWPDGTDQTDKERHYVVWNMRLAPPPKTFLVSGVSHNMGAVINESPCQFPDLDDVAIIDVPIDIVLSTLVEQHKLAAGTPFAKKAGSPYKFFKQAVANTCHGDLLLDLEKCTTQVRAHKGWDVFDLTGQPWITISGKHYYVKTQRLQCFARQRMADEFVARVVMFEGHPDHEASKSKGMFYARQ